jgi:hypothetical protein
MKDESFGGIWWVIIIFFIILMIGGWRGVWEWGSKVLFILGVLYMAAVGIPLLKRYIFDTDVSNKSQLTRGAHTFVLKPLSLIQLIFSAVFCAFFIIRFVLARTAGIIGE